jgi:regulator of sigma E protease
MHVIGTVLVIVIILGLVIFVHEAGHLLFAKLARVEVTDFALGFGPSLISIRWRGTRYHICAFPLGGFVRVSGMEPDDPLTENSFRAKHPLWRFLILAGGSLGNVVLAVVLIFVLSFIGFPKSAVMVQRVVPEGPAAEKDIRAGDIIEEIDGRRITDSRTLAERIQEAAARKRPVNIALDRRGETITREVVPRIFSVEENGEQVPYNEGRPSLGVMNVQVNKITPLTVLVTSNSAAADAGIKPGDRIISVGDNEIVLGTDVYFLIDPEGKGAPEPVDVVLERAGERLTVTVPAGTTIASLGIVFDMELERLPFAETISRALQNVYYTTIAFISQLRLLATAEGAKMVSGPLGIAELISQSFSAGPYYLIMITMVITLNLGLLNLFPIPALDGGHILFLLLNSIGMRIDQRKEALAHKVGFVVLISLILLITFRDALGLTRLWG